MECHTIGGFSKTVFLYFIFSLYNNYFLFSNVAHLYVTKYSCNNCVVGENTPPMGGLLVCTPTPPKILI